MNRTKEHSIARKVLGRISRKGGDTFWSFADFSDFNAHPVAAALSRLSRAGLLKRIRRGVYYYPKKTSFGESKPDPEAALDAILRVSKATSVAGGSGSFHRLGLTTQMAGTMTRSSDRRLRRRSVLGVPVKIAFRSKESLKDITPTERTFLESLRNLSHIPDTSPEVTLERLRSLLTDGTVSFERLAHCALTEPARVRALLGAIAETVFFRHPALINSKALGRLRSSLNPLTTYRLNGAARSLKNHSRWNLV